MLLLFIRDDEIGSDHEDTDGKDAVGERMLPSVLRPTINESAHNENQQSDTIVYCGRFGINQKIPTEQICTGIPSQFLTTMNNRRS